MPFGKFQNKLRRECRRSTNPEWLLENIELREPLKTEIEDELRYRYAQQARQRTHERQERYQHERAIPALGPCIRVAHADVAIVRELIDGGYRAAARRHHPDVGGDPNVMVRLNAVAESLRAQLAALEAA